MRIARCIPSLIATLLFGLLSVVNASSQVDWETYSEFGRANSVSSKQDDVNIMYRELMETELLFLSMSMSMHYTTAPTTRMETPAPAPPSPTTSPTTVVPPVRVGCDEQTQTVLKLLLEVDTAIGVEPSDFFDDLALALTDALSTEYAFCGSDDARRLGSDERKLEDALGFLIGGINVHGESSILARCSPQSDAAAECTVVDADIEVSGDDTDNIKGMLASSIEFVLANDQSFDDFLLLKGIVDVRVYEDDQTPSSVNTAIEPEGGNLQARPAVVAVLTVAGGVVVVAGLVLRRFGWISSAEAYKEVVEVDAASHDETVPATMAGSVAV